MFRIGLFLLTNLAIIVVASISLRILGFESILANNSMDLDLSALLVFCAVFGFMGSFISLLMSKFLAKKSSGTYIIQNPSNQQERWLLETVASLAKKADIGMPEVGIFPAQQSNAFATGWNRNNALVAVSTGLLERFNEDEARAVLAHEIGHVANGDMITLSLVQGVVNTFVMFAARLIGYFVDRVVLKNQRGLGNGLLYNYHCCGDLFGSTCLYNRYVVFAPQRISCRLCRRSTGRANSYGCCIGKAASRNTGTDSQSNA